MGMVVVGSCFARFVLQIMTNGGNRKNFIDTSSIMLKVFPCVGVGGLLLVLALALNLLSLLTKFIYYSQGSSFCSL